MRRRGSICHLSTLILFASFGVFSLVSSAEEEWQNCEIFLAPSDTGWGVYASRSFKKGEIVDMTPAIVPTGELDVIENSVLDDYVYGYFRLEGSSLLEIHVVMIGYGMFYNHHPEPNIQYQTFGREPAPDVPRSSNAIGFTARRDIREGEQLFTTYGEKDGGKEWFHRHGIKMVRPAESRIAPEEMASYRQDYCSKIQAGIGIPTWKDRILPIFPHGIELPFWKDLSRFAPFDAGLSDAKAKVPIPSGSRIEISTALVMSRKMVRGHALGAVVISWEDLFLEHQTALRTLRENGQMILQYQGVDIDWKRIDRFQSFEDLALLPNSGNIGTVRRVGDGPSNCRMVIHSEGAQDSVGVTVELIATKDISVGDILALNLPQAGLKEERNELKREMKLTGMPHHVGMFSDGSDEL